nr:MAG TPA: hypothetical protein [Caudoviricetes sp.]
MLVVFQFVILSALYPVILIVSYKFRLYFHIKKHPFRML